MIARDVRARSGITLTEILIAILIMGVGLISLATLFPLGLLRLREATRSSRGGLTFETAENDMDTRVLFYKPSFSQTWYWTPIGKQVIPRDPFTQDALPNGSIGDGTAAGGVISSGTTLVPNNNVGLSTGLPFCYDPLWRSITKVMPNVALVDPTLDFQSAYVSGVAADEARFGAGVFSNLQSPYIRNDPLDNGLPSAYGLQRLTNFIPWSGVANSLNNQYPFTTTNWNLALGNQPTDVAGTVFSSNDDIVFNAFTGNPNNASPLIPDMSTGGPQADYRFTWFVTGHQVDAGGNGAQFTGEVVVCDGRQFGWDPLPGLGYNAPAGEIAVEAIFGYGSAFNSASRVVLLRWPTTMPDPQVRVGGWICDVTYERNPQVFKNRSTASVSAFARCYWYQVGKRSDPQADVTGLPTNGNPYRSMVVTLTSPVRAKTFLTGGAPVSVNVALVMPSVINVFPRAFEAIPISTP